MKQAVFCIVCLALLNIINTIANQQMKQDTHKVQQMGYVM